MNMKTFASVLLAITVATAGPCSAFAQQQSQRNVQTATQPVVETPKEGKKRGGLLGSIFGQGARTKESNAGKGAASAPVTASPAEQVRPRSTTTTATSGAPNVTSTAASAATEVTVGDGNRHELSSEEEAAIVPYYNNFMSNYRIGPEDVISITVFGLDRYTRTGIIVPPDGMIAHPLIPEGILVVGKTRTQVQAEVKKYFDEMIVNPMVTVSVDKANSARYSVIGDVAQPGIKTMNRRLSVYEALSEAGGVLQTGDKRKVFLLRRQTDGTLQPKVIDIAAIERGKAADLDYLVPGDQVVVPGNTFKKVQTILNFLPIISFARMFTGRGW